VHNRVTCSSWTRVIVHGICDELKVRLRGAQEAWQSVMIVMWAYLTPELFSFAHEQGSGIECNVGIFVPGPESLSQT